MVPEPAPDNRGGPLPDENGTLVVDLSKQRGAMGPVVHDPGLRNTALSRSAISHLDGIKGELYYRGYSVLDLATQATFGQVVHLLLHGSPPSRQEATQFEENARQHRLLSEAQRRLICALPTSTHPMTALAVGLSTLDLQDPRSVNASDSENTAALERIIAVAPSIVGVFLHHRAGLGTSYRPSVDDSYVESVFRATCEPTYLLEDLTGERHQLLERMLIASAEHGMNCSTTAVRVVGSARAPPTAAVAAGIHAFSGRWHGGALERVGEMLRSVREKSASITQFVDRAAQGNPDHRLYGFGHRVYRAPDPRTSIALDAYERLVQTEGLADPLYATAVDLAFEVSRHPYFVERGIFPTVDLYSGLCYRAIGIPETLAGVVATLSRLTGWLAHWKEAVQAATPIVRPRDLHFGSFVPREWPSIADSE